MTNSNLEAPAVTPEERKRFHAIFNDWLNEATEADWIELGEARERFAPGEICSVVRLVNGCLARQELAERLPASLRARLQERHWPQADADAPATAGAAARRASPCSPVSPSNRRVGGHRRLQ